MKIGLLMNNNIRQADAQLLTDTYRYRYRKLGPNFPGYLPAYHNLFHFYFFTRRLLAKTITQQNLKSDRFLTANISLRQIHKTITVNVNSRP